MGKWEENYRRLREEHGVDELKESYKMAAIKMILTEEIKRHVELKEEDIKNYGDLRSVVMSGQFYVKQNRRERLDHRPWTSAHCQHSLGLCNGTPQDALWNP